MILITVIERSELEGIFGVVVHRCGIDSPRSGPALNNLLEQHPSVSSVRVYDSRFAISAESARDAPWNPPFGASSWAWLILSFSSVFSVLSLETFFHFERKRASACLASASPASAAFGATRAGMPATETKLTLTPIL